jgi:hypothetical protein
LFFKTFFEKKSQQNPITKKEEVNEDDEEQDGGRTKTMEDFQTKGMDVKDFLGRKNRIPLTCCKNNILRA